MSHGKQEMEGILYLMRLLRMSNYYVLEQSTFVNRQINRLIQFSCNCAFLDKEELSKKLVVLQLFCIQ